MKLAVILDGFDAWYVYTNHQRPFRGPYGMTDHSIVVEVSEGIWGPLHHDFHIDSGIRGMIPEQFIKVLGEFIPGDE